jgi:hypothetical protein
VQHQQRKQMGEKHQKKKVVYLFIFYSFYLCFCCRVCVVREKFYCTHNGNCWQKNIKRQRYAYVCLFYVFFFVVVCSFYFMFVYMLFAFFYCIFCFCCYFLGPFKYSHAQLIKDGVIVESEVPEER